MAHLLYNAAEVRAELYDEWNRLQHEWNDHLARATRDGKPCQPDCSFCKFMRANQFGINRCIRRFGGRVRR